MLIETLAGQLYGEFKASFSPPITVEYCFLLCDYYQIELRVPSSDKLHIEKG